MDYLSAGTKKVAIAERWSLWSRLRAVSLSFLVCRAKRARQENDQACD